MSVARPEKRGLAHIPAAFRYSLAGLRTAYLGEAAFRLVVLLNLVLIPLAFVLDVTAGERALLIGSCLLALIIELLNSAVEAVIDRISLELHPLSKNAKDMGSAAQLVTFALILTVWSLVLLG
jgi:diacylglycerol kinase (ATP)